MDVISKATSPYRELTPPAQRRVPRWKRALLWVLPESVALAQFESYRRLVGGRWAFAANDIGRLQGWSRVETCPAEWDLIDAEEIERANLSDPLLALTAISNNLMVVEHRAGCTCEVWPDP